MKAAALTVAFGLVVVASAAGVVAGGHTNNQPPKPKAPDCSPVLSKPKHGKDAVSALGSNIAAVAQKHGKDANKLAKQLNTDSSVWVDTCGELYVQEND